MHRLTTAAAPGARQDCRLVCALAVLTLFLLPTTALAQSKAERIEQLFTVLDANADGVISFDEFQINKMQLFFLSDLNEDGYLTLDEVDLTAEVFAAADRDGDGRLSGVEFVDAPFTNFSSFDADRDGVLSFEELRNLAQAVMR